MLDLELIGQTRKRIPSQIGRSVAAGTGCKIQILATARAKPFAIFLAESTAGQGEQHLFAHHIFKRKTALLIITDFCLIGGNCVFPGDRIGLLGPEHQVELSAQRQRHRLDAAGAENLEVAMIRSPQPDVVDLGTGVAVLTSRSAAPRTVIGPTWRRSAV